MPYNPSTGVYSLPAIYLAVPGTVIIAAQHNTPLVDLQTANNYERPIIAGGTGAGSIAGTVANFSLVQYTAQTLDDAQKAQARSNIGSATAGTFEQKSANYPVLAEDLGKTFLFTASATASFEAAADLGANFECEIWANFGVTVILDPNASETINGASTFVLQPGDKVTVWCNGTALFAKAAGDPTVGPQTQGFYTGLALTTDATDAANDVDIAVGVAAADVSPYNLMQLTGALVKRIDAAWAVGTNQGGLDTGSVSDTTYYVWLIQRSDTGVVDALFSLSSTAPTMPTNYDRKRLLGTLIRASSTNGAPAPTGNPNIVKAQPAITPSGTATTYTGIDAGVNTVVIKFLAMTLSANAQLWIRLGTSGGIVSSGYDYATSGLAAAAVQTVFGSSATFVALFNASAAGPFTGTITLKRVRPNAHEWNIQFLGRGSAANFEVNASVTLSAELTQFQISSVAGTSTLGGANSLAVEWWQ